MFLPGRSAFVTPRAAWTDYTPPGPWADGTIVTRNADGVGLVYNATLNTLTVIPNKSYSVKNANSFIVQNLPAPTVSGDAANKAYVDAHSGGGGISDAPSDGTYYGRLNATWANVAPLASPALTGTPTSTTPATVDNTTKIATTAFVKAQGYLLTNATITLSGDTTGSGTTAITTTLATVNANVGTFQGITVNAKGLVTAAAAQGYLTANQTITLSGDVTGSGATSIASTVGKLLGRTLSATAPTDGQVLQWVNATTSWTPVTPSSGAGPYTSTPAANSGAGSAGSSVLYARGDHVHPLTHPIGCGRFQIVSATQVGFYPFNGDLVKINGIVYSIPSAGVTANNTGCFINGTGGSNLAASTTYFVYLFNNSGTLTIDFSTTNHTTDSTAGNVGVQIKSSDSTRSLIGMIYTNASSQFQDNSSLRGVLSWFNRVQKVGAIAIGNNSTGSTSAVYVQMGSSSIIVSNWGEDLMFGHIFGQAYTSTNGCIGSISMAFDSLTGQVGNQFIEVNDSTHPICFSYSLGFNAAQGSHGWFGTFYGSLNATASTLASQNVFMYIETRG